MADVRDEFGNPVQLTDKFGNPMNLTGVATTHPPAAVVEEVHVGGMSTGVMTGEGMIAAKPNNEDLARMDQGIIGSGTDGGESQEHQHQETLGKRLAEEENQEHKEKISERSREIQRTSSSSSSSSSEDDGQGGWRKKKGLKQKIKEKLMGGKYKEEEHSQTPSATTTTTTAAPGHEKKSMMERIKEKLPSHHNH